MAGYRAASTASHHPTMAPIEMGQSVTPQSSHPCGGTQGPTVDAPSSIGMASEIPRRLGACGQTGRQSSMSSQVRRSLNEYS